jgi:nucleoside-diphosphate-sugar epimerase
MKLSFNTSDLEDEYQRQFGLKKLIFKNGIPYGYNKSLNKEIKFLCIHCQGGAKGVMRFLYYKQLRDFYYIGNLVRVTKGKMKLLIKKIISNK